MNVDVRVWVFFALGLLAPPALAATFSVNDTGDRTDANPGDGLCEATVGVGDCTLRAAVMEANALGGAHSIELPHGTFELTIAGVGNDDASAGDLDVFASITLRGVSAGATRIDGGGAMRLFHVHSGLLDLENLTLRNGLAGSATEHSGAGVLAEGFVGLRRVHMSGHRANAGAAIRAYFTAVEIEDSVFSDNRAQDLGHVNPFGNALSGTDTQFIVLRSTFSHNGPPVGSGSSSNNIHVVAGGLQMINSTIADNNGSGVVMQNADMLIRQSTLAGNYGTQLHTFSASGTHQIELSGSLLQRMPWGFVVCSGSGLQSLGYNISEDGTCGLAASGDLESTDAQLGPLSMNGGPTPTRLPVSGSPAIDRVPVSACLDEDEDPLDHDQRGLPRPVPNGGACDSGAVEFGNEHMFSDRFES